MHSSSSGKLDKVRDFWNETPCDGHESYALRARFRYAKEPWLYPLLKKIAAEHANILEIGCGQGTDGITLCQFMAPGGTYLGVDMSTTSIDNARRAAQEMMPHLKILPGFHLENAEQLSFKGDSVDCVVSVGALHHSADTGKAIREVYRVLRPGGKAYVFLYRTAAPKLLIAHALRGLQAVMDKLFRTKRLLYRISRTLNMDRFLGTMIYECFGVEILRSYTRKGMRKLFGDFPEVRLTAYGTGLPPIGFNRMFDSHSGNVFGYLWLAEVRK